MIYTWLLWWRIPHPFEAIAVKMGDAVTLSIMIGYWSPVLFPRLMFF